MGASEGVDGGIGMDGSVGTIVWVRRRNGSWWPGRILGQDELSASHLMSPRSGTPVKLLGRDDASVDWYNLEKSKRVKAFRCGEFDACIERAEASQSVLTKKREKYARREDAILHALELEKQQKSEAETNSVNDKYSGDFKKELNINSSSEICPKDNESIDLGKSLNRKPQIRGKVVFLEEVNGSRLLNARQGGHGKQVYWEDDNCENMSRMRGLQDFGLWIAPSNQEVSLSVACESSEAVSDHVDVISDCVECVNGASGGKTPLVDKEKRSHGLVEEYLVKRCDRHRPLVQVLQNSAKLTAVRSLQAECESPSILGQEEQHMGAICHVNRSRCMCSPADSSDCLDHSGCSLDLMQLSPTQIGCSNGLQQLCSLAGEDVSSGLINEIDTGSSVRHLVDGDMEDCATLPQDYTPFVPESRNSGTHVRQGVSTLGNQENLGKMSNDYKTSISYCQAISLRNDKAPGTADMGVSKWHMKGKRNTRNLAKRSLEVLNGKNSVFSSDSCNGYPTGSLYGKNKKRGISIMGQESSSGPGFYKKAEVLNHAYDDDDDDSIFFEKGLKNRLVGFGKRSYPSMIKASKDHPVCGINDYDDSHEMFSSVWEVDEPPHLALRPYWVEADECLDASFVHPLNVEMDPPLIDVNLKVQASYHGEHVPLVSLMSRLNGKAIIGHPVHIEILEDGLTNLLFPRNGKRLDSTAVIEHAAPPHVWRTGRRTAMQRVPRPYLAVSALEGEETELIPYSDREHRPLFKKSDAAPTHQASSLTITDHCRLTSMKSNKSVSKKGSMSSHKTRTLSSIATEQKRNGMNTSAKQERDGGSVLDGLIKPGGTVPLVTCVPVKVAFSRLREAVGRPASAGMARWGLLGGLAVGNPL